jgi:hypothetical protein
MPRQSKYSWSDASGRYRGPGGQFVSFTRVRSFLDGTLDSNEKAVVRLGEQLKNREITLGEWQIGMRDNLKSIHLTSGSLAQGGWAQMSPADFGRVGARLKEQYKFLGKFSKEIEAGLPLDGRFKNRVKLYAQSGRVSYDAIQRAEMLKRGMKEEKNILHPADHCRDCLAQTALGWVPIGTLTLIGQRICSSNDRCTKIYRR